MNYDELAFVNQQLAAMLKTGIPLEGALRQLCETMQRGDLRTEFQKLEADLATGTPLKDALAARQLPEFYVHMIQVGIASNNLPGVLILVADYYQKVNSIWARLKGLMVYPLIVAVGSLALSVLLAVLFGRSFGQFRAIHYDLVGDSPLPAFTEFMNRYGPVGLWAPVIVLAFITVAAILLCALPSVRRRMRWRIPAFREASVWQLASTLALLLQGGCPLGEALGLARQLEEDSPAKNDLAHWQTRLESGHARFADLAGVCRVLPGLFVWIVASAGEDLATGFKRAADIYHDRAVHRIEYMLYAVLPMSVVVLGTLIFIQVLTLASMILGGFLPLIGGPSSLGSN